MKLEAEEQTYSAKTSDVITTSHKEDLISKVKIDEKTYLLIFWFKTTRFLECLRESEIFALSLLQALGEVSNRKLPVVIDTP